MVHIGEIRSLDLQNAIGTDFLAMWTNPAILLRAAIMAPAGVSARYFDVRPHLHFSVAIAASASDGITSANFSPSIATWMGDGACPSCRIRRWLKSHFTRFLMRNFVVGQW